MPERKYSKETRYTSANSYSTIKAFSFLSHALCGLPLKPKDDATDSLLGYLYQLRFGLLQGLQCRDVNGVIAIELLDDISLASDAAGQTTNVHQLKHSVKGIASIGPKSETVWKTLGNWATKIQDKSISLEHTQFFLHTTANITKRSPLYYLQEEEDRDEEKARDILLSKGEESDAKIVKKHFKVFSKLGVKKQKLLLSRMTAFGNELKIDELAQEIEVFLSVSSRPEHLAAHRRGIEGWMFDRVIISLLESSERLIAVGELKAVSAQVRDSLVPTDLPDEFSSLPVPEAELLTSDSRPFARQLRLVGLERKLKRAQSDHFRAFTARSEWSREGLLAIHELPRFDDTLVDEWGIRHEDICAATEFVGESEKAEAAQGLYQWVEQDAPQTSHLLLRTSFTKPFLIRGSFHVLSNKLLVGWHPDFLELMESPSAV